jgi:hypothetical protein
MVHDKKPVKDTGKAATCRFEPKRLNCASLIAP